MTETRKPSRTRDSLLAHCIARAVIARQGGIEAASERYGPKAERLPKRIAYRDTILATGKATRVCTFLVMWALALDELDRDEISVEDYYRWANASSSSAYKLRDDYRDLFPDAPDPNAVARPLRDFARAHSERSTAALMTAQVAL
jgi:hypothetical protein